jgi:hypothetical protein
MERTLTCVQFEVSQTENEKEGSEDGSKTNGSTAEPQENKVSDCSN